MQPSLPAQLHTRQDAEAHAKLLLIGPGDGADATSHMQGQV